MIQKPTRGKLSLGETTERHTAPSLSGSRDRNTWRTHPLSSVKPSSFCLEVRLGAMQRGWRLLLLGAGIYRGTESRGLGESMHAPHLKQIRFQRMCTFERNSSWPDKIIPHEVP